MSVKAQSTISLASVKTVNDASQFAVQQAGIAKASADNASEYASRALGNLATVQSVTETLTWITQHGTMTLTTDTVLDPTHVYFVLDPNGDYTVGSNTYSIVTEPSVQSLSSYYELTIDESLNNYVGTHLALTSEGLWLLPASTNANKVLIATGAGTTYTTAGTYLIDSNNDVVASFRANGVTIGRENYGHVEIANDGMVVRGEQDGSALTGNDNNTYIASRTIFVGGGADTALASIDLGSSRSNLLSFHDTSGGANEHRTQIETRYDGATATATDVSTILDAVGVNNKTARLEMSVDSNAQSECYISADSINWNGKPLFSTTTVSFNLTTGSAVARFAPDSTNNLGTAVVNLNTLSELTDAEILLAVPIDASRNSGQDRAFLEVSGSQARIWGRPNLVYSCRIQVLYR